MDLVKVDELGKRHWNEEKVEGAWYKWDSDGEMLGWKSFIGESRPKSWKRGSKPGSGRKGSYRADSMIKEEVP
jgi:hypothetical protein